jgi:hypothetical protein
MTNGSPGARAAYDRRGTPAGRGDCWSTPCTNWLPSTGSGSYLVIGHGASDIEPEAAAELQKQYNQRSPVKIRLRSREEVAPFFDGLQPVGRGLVRLDTWWDTDDVVPDTASGLAGWVGIARKP